MTRVSLREFQKLAGLSDRALVWLLCNNKLSCQLDESGGITIDIEETQIRDLIEALATKERDLVDEKKRLITEKFSRIVSDQFDLLTREALERLASE